MSMKSIRKALEVGLTDWIVLNPIYDVTYAFFLDAEDINLLPDGGLNLVFSVDLGNNDGIRFVDSPFSWQNIPYKPEAGKFYIRASLIPAETQNPTLGDEFNRKTGILQLLIYTKEGNGSADSELIADSLMDYFARGQSFTADAITVRILESPSVNLALNDGGWYITPVSVRYTADIF